MAKRQVTVGPVVRLKAVGLGAIGRAWLDALPDLVGELEHRWSIRITEPLAGGTAAFVARAETTGGTEAIVKVGLPEPHFANQIRTLAAADGRGYARLLAHDAARHAMLMEALGPALDRLALAPERQIETLCEMLPLAWQVPPEPSAAAVNKADGLAKFVTKLWAELDRPCPERVVTEALRCAQRRSDAFEPGRCVVLHGDAAPPNALQVLVPRAGAETGFVFVDPEGFIGDPSYDLGVVLRDWCPQLLAGGGSALAERYCSLLSAWSGLDEVAIWEWGFLERVSTGLFCLSFGARDLARPLLETAAMLV